MSFMDAPLTALAVETTVNGVPYTISVPVRRLLSDFLRDDLGLTGTHVGCEHGVCGACTVHLDGDPVRSCITLAVEADGRQIRTVEGLAQPPALTELQTAFSRHHALQCGFCTAGILMTVQAADRDDYPTDDDIRQLLSGNLCRCTGYVNIVAAVRDYWGRGPA